MSDNVQQIMSIANVSEEKAKACLEAANGDLSTAIEFATAEHTEPVNQGITQQAPVASINIPVSKPPPKKNQERTGIKGLGDLGGDQDKKEDPNKKKDLNWYTGGASSGLAVQAPPQPADIIKNVFDNAKRHGAISKSDEAPQEKEKFGGSGFVLGNTNQSSVAIPSQPKPPGIRRLLITFYKDCFTVDDGPPRKLSDPANEAFIKDVNNGVVPREVAGNGEEVDVELINKNNEEYKPPPKPSVVSFSGSGQSLGGHQIHSSSILVPRKIVVDASVPVTTIQVRTHNGQRIVIKANQTHTVGDLRSHIEAECPVGKPFELRTTFPPQVLANDGASIKDAGLLNAAIVQRI